MNTSIPPLSLEMNPFSIIEYAISIPIIAEIPSTAIFFLSTSIGPMNKIIIAVTNVRIVIELPIKFPIPIWLCPITDEIIELVISGIFVPQEIMKIPIRSGESPKISPILEAYFIAIGLKKTRPAIPNSVPIMLKIIAVIKKSFLL